MSFTVYNIFSIYIKYVLARKRNLPYGCVYNHTLTNNSNLNFQLKTETAERILMVVAFKSCDRGLVHL